MMTIFQFFACFINQTMNRFINKSADSSIMTTIIESQASLDTVILQVTPHTVAPFTQPVQDRNTAPYYSTSPFYIKSMKEERGAT